MDCKNCFPRINFPEASALFLLLLILSATMARAQILYGTISGNVTDSSGAKVADPNRLAGALRSQIVNMEGGS